MPQLKEYTARADTLAPTERGTDARLQAARRTGAFYNQAAGAITGAAEAQSAAANDVARSAGNVANAVETVAQQQETYAGHREVSKGAAAGAQLFSNLTDQWDKTVKAADPNDPSVAAKFRETVLEPTLQGFKEAYGNTDLGARWSEQHVETMRNHFFQKTAADMSGLAAQAVKVNVDQLANSTSNAAFKSPDHHTVGYLLGQVDSSVAAIVDSSNIKGAAAAKVQGELTQSMKEKIVKSAASGAISKASDPEKVAQDFADRYPDYLNGADIGAFARAAKVQSKANTLQDKQIETYQRQEADRAVHRASAKVMADNVSFDDNGRAIVKPEYFRQSLDIARQYPDAPSAAATVHAAITWGEHQQNQKAQATVSDPATKSKLYDGLFDPTNPTTEIDLMKANVAGKLSPHDFQSMHQLQKTLEETPLKGEVMKDTLAAVKASITYSMPGLPGKDPKGLQNYSAFIQQFIPEYIRQSRAGTLPANALDTRDPKSLISQSMAPFKRDWKTMARDREDELKSLTEDKNLTGGGKVETGRQIVDIPAGMSPADALKKYGPGPIKLPDGRTKVLQ